MAITVRGLDDGDLSLVNRLLDHLEAKKGRNTLRRRYYDGRKLVRQVGSVIPPQYYRLAIVLGWAGKAVDTLANRINLEGFEWPDGSLANAGSDRVWDDNDFAAEIDSAVDEALICGLSFLVNTSGAEGEPKSLIHVKDANNATGEWNSRTRRMSNLLSILSRDDKGDPNSMALYLDGRTITMMMSETGWMVQDDTRHLWGVPVEMLAFKPRTSRPYGSSRISRPVMSLQNAALRTMVRMEGHADFYSMPELWLMGADEAIFTNPDGSRKTPWQMAIGRIKAIPDNDEVDGPNARADVKQFKASTPVPHIEFLKVQAQQFSAETSIPVTSLGLTELANPTSEASYGASREDLISAAEKTIDRITGPVSRAWGRALAIANRTATPPSMSSIEAKWRSPRYQSKAAEADAGAKILAVAPELVGTRVGYELLGLSPKQIDSIREDLTARDNAGQQVETQPPPA